MGPGVGEPKCWAPSPTVIPAFAGIHLLLPVIPAQAGIHGRGRA